MVKISIASLIYKSPLFADFVYTQVHKYTPMLQTGEAEFFFVANDASDEVLEHLKAKNYPFFIQTNEKFSNDQLFKMGYGKPEYIHRVYKAWNKCIQEAKGEYVCLINSDMGFSENWLENMLKHCNDTTAVSSLLIERGNGINEMNHFPDWYNGTGSILHFCGKDPNTYDEEKFLSYVNKNREINKEKITDGGTYMPIIFKRSKAMEVGMYPEGNIAGTSFDDVIDYGDRVFMRKLNKIGVRHITSWDSFSYHFMEGEMNY
jgi:glycosyltransferase involved in cell wall biosynthesis